MAEPGLRSGLWTLRWVGSEVLAPAGGLEGHHQTCWEPGSGSLGNRPSLSISSSILHCLWFVRTSGKQC